MTIGVGILWTGISTTAAVTGVYFSNQSTITEKVTAAKESVAVEISANKQRISTLEEAVKNIKENQIEQGRDIKEILKLLK